MLREPVGGGVVEEVGFVEVGGVVGGGQVEWGFAGQGPGFEGGVDEVGAPGGGVAGGKEGDGFWVGVGGGGGAGAKVGEGVEGGLLVEGCGEDGEEEVGG